MRKTWSGRVALAILVIECAANVLGEQLVLCTLRSTDGASFPCKMVRTEDPQESDCDSRYSYKVVDLSEAEFLVPVLGEEITCDAVSQDGSIIVRNLVVQKAEEKKWSVVSGSAVDGTLQKNEKLVHQINRESRQLVQTFLLEIKDDEEENAALFNAVTIADPNALYIETEGHTLLGVEVVPTSKRIGDVTWRIFAVKQAYFVYGVYENANFLKRLENNIVPEIGEHCMLVYQVNQECRFLIPSLNASEATHINWQLKEGEYYLSCYQGIYTLTCKIVVQGKRYEAGEHVYYEFAWNGGKFSYTNYMINTKLNEVEYSIWEAVELVNQTKLSIIFRSIARLMSVYKGRLDGTLTHLSSVNGVLCLEYPRVLCKCGLAELSVFRGPELTKVISKRNLFEAYVELDKNTKLHNDEIFLKAMFPALMHLAEKRKYLSKYSKSALQETVIRTLTTEHGHDGNGNPCELTKIDCMGSPGAVYTLSSTESTTKRDWDAVEIDSKGILTYLRVKVEVHLFQNSELLRQNFSQYPATIRNLEKTDVKLIGVDSNSNELSKLSEGKIYRVTAKTRNGLEIIYAKPYFQYVGAKMDKCDIYFYQTDYTPPQELGLNEYYLFVTRNEAVYWRVVVTRSKAVCDEIKEGYYKYTLHTKEGTQIPAFLNSGGSSAIYDNSNYAHSISESQEYSKLDKPLINIIDSVPQEIGLQHAENPILLKYFWNSSREERIPLLRLGTEVKSQVFIATNGPYVVYPLGKYGQCRIRTNYTATIIVEDLNAGSSASSVQKIGTLKYPLKYKVLKIKDKQFIVATVGPGYSFMDYVIKIGRSDNTFGTTELPEKPEPKKSKKSDNKIVTFLHVFLETVINTVGKKEYLGALAVTQMDGASLYELHDDSKNDWKTLQKDYKHVKPVYTLSKSEYIPIFYENTYKKLYDKPNTTFALDK